MWARRPSPWLLLPAALVLAGAGAARAEEPWLVQVEGAAGAAVADPQSSRFSPGFLPSAGGYRALGPRFLLGARLRLGALFDKDGGEDPSLRAPGAGGLGALLLSARFRPLAKEDEVSRVLGPWVEGGAGPGLTGSLVRPVGEVGVGWAFKVKGLALGPSLRYLHVVQPGGLDGADAKLVLLGVELNLLDAKPAPPQPVMAAALPPDLPAEAPEPPPAPAPPAEAPAAAGPIADEDGDGIADAEDRCPKEAEDKDGFEDTDGCPDPDNDRDGIADAADRCPLEAETLNGIDDKDGCPDEGLIEVINGRVVLDYNVLYATNRARVRSRARLVLQAVVELWRQHPEWQRIDVEGHADKRGPAKFNMVLSRERANRVRSLLVKYGFPEKQIHARGYGSTRPREEGDTPEAYRRNRRVELVIREREGGPTS
jgi:outer membrane protein OmpA-like peptidoglycan-associated protein